MNCERLQENLFEYLDGALPSSEMEAARRHVAECGGCREKVEHEKAFERSMSERFREAVTGIQLEEHVRRRIATALERKVAEPRRARLVLAWKRLFFPIAATGALAVALIQVGQHRAVTPAPQRGTARVSSQSPTREVSVHIMYCAPNYTFHRDGDTVIDALTCDPQVAEGNLIVNN